MAWHDSSNITEKPKMKRGAVNKSIKANLAPGLSNTGFEQWWYEASTISHIYHFYIYPLEVRIVMVV